MKYTILFVFILFPSIIHSTDYNFYKISNENPNNKKINNNFDLIKDHFKNDVIQNNGTASAPETTLSRLKLNNIYHVVGSTYNISTTIPITQNVWAKVTNATQNMWQGTESDGFTMVTDSMVFQNAGDYFGMFAISYSANLGNDWMFRIFEPSDSMIHFLMNGQTTTGDTNFVTFTAPFYLEDMHINDTLVLQMMNTSSGDDAIIKSAYFVCYYLHE